MCTVSCPLFSPPRSLPAPPPSPLGGVSSWLLVKTMESKRRRAHRAPRAFRAPRMVAPPPTPPPVGYAPLPPSAVAFPDLSELPLPGRPDSTSSLLVPDEASVLRPPPTPQAPPPPPAPGSGGRAAAFGGGGAPAALGGVPGSLHGPLMQGFVRALPAYGTRAGPQHRALPAAYSLPSSFRPSSSASALESLAGPLYPLGLASSQAGISPGSPAAGLLREADPNRWLLRAIAGHVVVGRAACFLSV